MRFFLFARIISAVFFLGKSASETLPLENCNFPFLQEEIPGVTPADISADGQGGVKVSIALAVPRGSGGRDPGILLKYSSSARNGRFGYGWTLAYLPTISRCPRKKIKNGYSDKVTFTLNDVFCVGGKQLVPVPGTGNNSYSYNGSKFYSEEFDKTVYQPFGPRSTHGPLYWISSHSNGVLTVYGRTTDSKVLVKKGDSDLILGWKPNQEMDPYGNDVNIAYVGNGKDNSEIYISQITYAEGQAAVVFDYEARPDVIKTFFSGSKQVISRRLQKITTYAAMPKNNKTAEDKEARSVLIPVRRYDITYISSELNGVSLVKTITVCSGCYEKCQRPYKFKYKTIPDGTAPIAFPFRLPSTTDDYGMFTCFSPEILSTPSLGAFTPAAICNVHTHKPVIYPSAVAATESNVQLSADVNSDGLTDLIFVQYDSAVGVHVNIYVSNGETFEPSNLEPKFQPDFFLCETEEAYCQCWTNLHTYETVTYEATGKFEATSLTVFEDDSRGEGLIDLIAVVLTKGPQSHLKSPCASDMPHVFILEVSGTQNTSEAPSPDLTAYSTDRSIDFLSIQSCSVMYGDVTDDFAKDVIISCADDEGWRVWTIDVRSGSVTLSEPYSSPQKSDITRNVLLRDLDGDGSPDLTMVSLQPSAIEILFSSSLRNGKFDFVSSNQKPYGNYNFYDSKSIRIFFAQIPGDTPNIVISSTINSAWYLDFFESKGNGKFARAKEEKVEGNFAQDTDVLGSDINGDGIPEILAVSPGKSTSDGLWLGVLYLRTLTGTRFDEYKYPPIPASDLFGKQYDEENSLFYSDFTGDGKTDIGIVRVRYLNKSPYCSELAANFYLLPSSLLRDAPLNKLIEMKDGHGLATTIAYSRMTDNSVYIQEGSAPKKTCTFWPKAGTNTTKQPYVNFQPSSEFLLQELSQSNAASNDSNDVITTKYVYRGYGSHTQGYGSLGFEFIFAYHSTTTKHSQLTTYSTDVSKHMDGHPVYTTMYKCGNDTITPITLSNEKSQWQLMTRIPSRQSPGFLFGSYFVVLVDKEEIVYSENGLPQPTRIKTKEVKFNSYDLPISTHTLSIDDSTNSKPYLHLLSNFHNNSLEIEYVEPFYYGYSWFVGLASAAVETSISHYGPINSVIDYATTSTIKRADRKYGTDGSLLSESFSSSNTSDPSDLEHALTILHERDERGNIITVGFVSSSGVPIANKTMKYDENGRFQLSLCSAVDACENWLYGHNGQLLVETLPSGEEICHTYDEFFRETKVNSSFGTTVLTTFGFCSKSEKACHNFSTAIYFKKTTSMFGTSVYEIYDKVDRSLGTTLSLNEKKLIQTNVYDSFGGFSKRTPVHYEIDPSHETMLFQKDDFGRTAAIRRTYLQPGTKLPFWQETSLKYSSNRVDISATDSSNTKPWKQARITDSLAHVSVVEETNIDHTLLYWYSPKGDIVATVINNTAINEQALVYRAKFDKFGAPYEIAFGNSGRYQYSHDSLGQLLNQTDPSGNVVYFRRNDQEKVSSIFSYSGQSGEKGFVHNFTYNNIFLDKIDQERGVTESGRTYSVNNTYDDRGLLRNTTVGLDNQTTSLAYHYDVEHNNRLERIEFPDGVTFLYNYDKKNRIFQVVDDSDPNQSQLLWTALDFDAEGRPSKELYQNGLQTAKSFEPWGISLTTTLLPKGVASFQNANRMAQNKPAFSFSANNDPSGRVVQRERYAQGRRVYFENISYDQDYQALSESSLYFNETYRVDSVVFSYGNFSNMAQKSDVGNYTYGSVSSFGEDYVNLLEASPVNRVLEVKSLNSSYTFKYDERGNRLSWNGTVITYNSRNKPITISRGPFLVSFEYSPLGKLLTKSDTVYIKFPNDTTVPVTYRQTWYMNDFHEEELVRENLSSSVMTKKIGRFYASANVLLQKTAYLNSSAANTKSYFYLHYDTKDSLAHVTDEEGNIVWEADYDVCGRKRNAASGKPEPRYDKVIALINRTALTLDEAEEILTSLRSNYTWNIGYDGHIHLFDLGDDLVHMRGRLYDTIHCLFLSPDPYLGNRWRAVGYHSYSYSEFNPLTSNDPSGYVSFWRILGHVLAAIINVFRQAFMDLIKLLALLPGFEWLDDVAALFDALLAMDADFLDGENWKAALIDGATTLLSDALSSLIDSNIASKIAKDIVKCIVTAALDAGKAAAQAAVTVGHNHRGKSIGLAAGIGAVEGLVGALVDIAGVDEIKPSVTKLISYSSASMVKSELEAIAATVTTDTICSIAKEGLRNIGKVINKYALTAKQDSKEAEFMTQGMSSMQRATMTNGPLLFGSELKASTGHDACRNENALKSTQFSHLIRSFVPAKGPLSIDAVANIEKASDSYGRSHVSLHNHAIIQALFAGYNKKRVRDELFLFDRVSQLILAPSTNGKFLRET